MWMTTTDVFQLQFLLQYVITYGQEQVALPACEPWAVESMQLKRSTLETDGARYTTLATVQLGSPGGV